MEFIYNLFSSDGFIPRSSCGVWPVYLINLHRLGDTIIALSYVLIPAGLFRLYQLHQQHRLNLTPLFSYRKVLTTAFVAFIASCGGTHVCQVLVWDWPAYRIFGIWTGITAIL